MPKCALFLWSVTALVQNSLSVSLKTAQTNSFFGAVDTYDSVEDSDLELSGGHAHSGAGLEIFFPLSAGLGFALE